MQLIKEFIFNTSCGTRLSIIKENNRQKFNRQSYSAYHHLLTACLFISWKSETVRPKKVVLKFPSSEASSQGIQGKRSFCYHLLVPQDKEKKVNVKINHSSSKSSWRSDSSFTACSLFLSWDYYSSWKRAVVIKRSLARFRTCKTTFLDGIFSCKRLGFLFFPL